MQALAASVFYYSRDGIMITSLDGNILAVNDAFSAITGYRADEVLGRNPRLLKSERQAPAFYRAMWDAIVRDGHWQGEAGGAGATTGAVIGQRGRGHLPARRRLARTTDRQGRPGHVCGQAQRAQLCPQQCAIAARA